MVGKVDIREHQWMDSIWFIPDVEEDHNSCSHCGSLVCPQVTVIWEMCAM